MLENFLLFLGIVLITLIILFVRDRLDLERCKQIDRLGRFLLRFVFGLSLVMAPFLTLYVCAKVGAELAYYGHEILALLSAPLCSLPFFGSIYGVYEETKPSRIWKVACLAIAGLNGVILIGGMGLAAYIFFGAHD